MQIYVVFFIALSLAMDAFSVALGAGAYFGKTSARQKFRLSFHFGLFQFFMPIIGWAAGITIVNIIKDFDHWVAFAILAVIGGKMIYDSFNNSIEDETKDITKGMNLISLSLATSIDALAVGFSMALIDGTILFPAVVIGLVAAGMTWLGIILGEKLSSKFDRRAMLIGGIILIMIGINIVLEHLEIF